mgnify:CR=1 FL=1
MNSIDRVVPEKVKTKQWTGESTGHYPIRN